jgi:hypothetical protein
MGTASGAPVRPTSPVLAHSPASVCNAFQGRGRSNFFPFLLSTNSEAVRAGVGVSFDQPTLPPRLLASMVANHDVNEFTCVARAERFLSHAGKKSAFLLLCSKGRLEHSAQHCFFSLPLFPAPERKGKEIKLVLLSRRPAGRGFAALRTCPRDERTSRKRKKK